MKMLKKPRKPKKQQEPKQKRKKQRNNPGQITNHEEKIIIFLNVFIFFQHNIFYDICCSWDRRRISI